jgi:hypothetical protein
MFSFFLARRRSAATRRRHSNKPASTPRIMPMMPAVDRPAGAGLGVCSVAVGDGTSGMRRQSQVPKAVHSAL